MWSGDSLSVLLFLCGTSLAAMMAAITAQAGWRSKTLWAICLVFFAAAITWLVAPSASPIIAAIRLVAGALVESNALAMLVIVGIVCLVVGGRGPPDVGVTAQTALRASRPAFAVPCKEIVRWSPDVTFGQAIAYLGAKSTWPIGKSWPDIEAATEELTSALARSKITAWGKAHPEDEEAFQITPSFWISASVTAKTNYAFSNNRGVAAYDVQLSLNEMKLVWPPKD